MNQMSQVQLQTHQRKYLTQHMGAECHGIRSQESINVSQPPQEQFDHNNTNNNNIPYREHPNPIRKRTLIPKPQKSQKFINHKYLLANIGSMQIGEIGSFICVYIHKQLQSYIDSEDLYKFQDKIVQSLQLVRKEVIQLQNLINALVETIDRVKRIKKTIIMQQQLQNTYHRMSYQTKLYKSTFQIFDQTLTMILSHLALNPMFLVNLWYQQGYMFDYQIRQKMTKQENMHFQKSQEVQCQICLIVIQQRLKAPLTVCKHVFHLDCIRNHIKSKIDSNIVQINCPIQQCKKQLTVNDLQTFLDHNTMEKYYRFTLNKYVESNDKNTSWCPTAGCSAVFQFDKKIKNYHCPVCKKDYCLKCRTEYHTGMTCKEFKKSKTLQENDRKFQEFVKGAKFKQCPSCKFWVQRTSGCPSIKCRCGIRFCYTCGGTTCPNGSCQKGK